MVTSGVSQMAWLGMVLVLLTAVCLQHKRQKSAPAFTGAYPSAEVLMTQRWRVSGITATLSEW